MAFRFYLIILFCYTIFGFLNGQEELESLDDDNKAKEYTSASSEEQCTPGAVYKQSCNTCQCNEKRQLLCTKMACQEDLKLIYPKGLIYNKTNEDNDNFSKRLSHTFKLKSAECTPGKIYKRSQHLCFCNDDSEVKCGSDKFTGKITMAKINSPSQIHPVFSDDEFIDLPSLVHAASECVPGRAYRVNCDTCLCLFDGNLLCTELLCLPEAGINRKQAARMSGQPCTLKQEVKNECVTCDCVNDVLQCKPVANCKPQLRNLHGGFRKNDTFLDYNAEKCTPNESYVNNCNVCHCQPYGSLRCTQKTCLTFSETQILREQIQYLQTHDDL